MASVNVVTLYNVMVVDPVIISMETFDLWLAGVTVEEATRHMVAAVLSGRTWPELASAEDSTPSSPQRRRSPASSAAAGGAGGSGGSGGRGGQGVGVGGGDGDDDVGTDDRYNTWGGGSTGAGGGSGSAAGYGASYGSNYNTGSGGGGGGGGGGVSGAGSSVSAEEVSTIGKLLLSEVAYQYRNFNIFASFMEDPLSLQTQMVLPLPPDKQREMIERYYLFDDSVMRELVKKLSKTVRRDMDSISERTGVSISSCQRQFDNLYRIYKTIEESEDADLSQVIEDEFLLSPGLAQRYSHAVFLLFHKMELSKKKLAFLHFSDLDHLTGLLLNTWTVPSVSEIEIDRGFVDELRDIRNFCSDKDVMNEYRSIVMAAFAEAGMGDDVVESVRLVFKPVVRALLTIGVNLSQSKEFRDLFIDIVEKVIDPLVIANLSMGQVYNFLNFVDVCFGNVDRIPRVSREQLGPAWSRFLGPVLECSIVCSTLGNDASR